MSNNISIDLGLYESQLRGEIASDLTTLQIALDGLDDSNYDARKYILKQGITVAEISVPPRDFLKRREINKCLKSIVGSLQDYMDKLIAIQRLTSEKIVLTPPVIADELNRLLAEKFEKHVLDVSTDRSLNVPRKLNLLLDKPDHEMYKNAAQSYFDLRIGLEHHKGIAKIDRVVRYKRLGLASTAGYEVEKPGPLGENEGLVLKAFDEIISYDKGGALLFTKEQLDSIILNILIFITPQIQTSAAERLNNLKS